MVRGKATVPTIKAVSLGKEVERRMRPIGQRIKKGLGGVTRTWKGEKPEFVSNVKREGGDVETFAGAEDDGSHGFEKLLFLNDGTRIRYAHMTPNFRAKTSNRNFISGRGAGGLLFVSRRRPLPGILPREWDTEANEIYEPIILREYDDAVKTVLDEMQ